MLTDPTCKNAKPQDKPYKLSDEKGMYLLINSNGAKYFRLKYRIMGKEKVLALGVYGEMTLKEARQKRDEARKQIADGIDPSANKQAIKRARADSAVNSFEVVAREWFGKKMTDKSESHQKKTLARLENDVFPWIGKKPIADIRNPDLQSVLKRVEDRGAIDTAHRILQTCGQILRYGISTKRLEDDVSLSVRGSLTPVSGGNFAAITEPKPLGALLRAIDDYAGSFLVKSALQISPALFVRPGELRAMEWTHLDLEAKEWRYSQVAAKSCDAFGSMAVISVKK